MNIDQLVGQQVRAAREARRLPQEGFADQVTERTGVQMSRTTVVRIERGERPVTIPELTALALVLRVPPAALVSPLDRDRTVVEMTPAGWTTEVSRLYFWWGGMEPPTDDTGALVADSHTEADLGPYRAALRVHVTQRAFLDARTNVAKLEGLREAAEDPASSFDRPPGEDDFAEARQHVLRAAGTFVRAIRNAHTEGLPAYQVHPDLWPDMAASEGRTDPFGWAAELGIEPYQPKASR